MERLSRIWCLITDSKDCLPFTGAKALGKTGAFEIGVPLFCNLTHQQCGAYTGHCTKLVGGGGYAVLPRAANSIGGRASLQQP